MSNSNTISDVEDEYENKLAALCEGVVDMVIATELGTLRVDVFDANMHDLDVIDNMLGVGSVERHPDGCLKITTEEQIAPCSVVR